MTTRVPIRYGGTGANTAAGARAALGVLANTGGTISGDLTITGNLIVSGNTTTLNTETLVIEDADIVLLSNVTGSPVLNAGITINRGNSTNTFLRWDEGADKWGWSDDGTNTYTFDTALSAYSQANAAYTAANNAKVTVFANNSSNVTTQNINFVNTSTVTVTVSADGSNANVAFTAAPQTVVVDTYAASGNTTAAATANIANGLFAIATDAYAQGNSAYTAANNAANTVRVSQNSTSTLSAKQLNFVNTANVTIVVADSGNGNANISFEVASGTGTLSNIGISSNGVFTTNANAFNFVNTSTVSVSVSSGVNGNANIAFNATVAGVNTVIRSETFTSANAAANLTYNILYYPVAVEYVFVNKNGIGLFPTTDYTLSGNTVTIKEAGESGDNIEIRYFVDVSTVPVSNTTIIVEANTVTAQTNTFTLSQNVATINRLSVTKNGLQLTPNTHYTLANGKTVTLTTLAEVDDQIVFRYFFDLGNIQDVGFTAYQQANAAYDQANLAYTAANNRVLKAGDTLTGTLNVQNVIPTTSNTYNLGSSSARFKDLWLSNSTIYLGDSSISANAGKIIVPAIETSSGINLESQVAAAYGQANSAYTQANSAYGQANAGYTQANSGYTQANSAYNQANSAYSQANAGYTQANSGYTQANSAYTAANTAQTTAQNAYGQANSAYLQANNAYTAANNSNLKLGGVISGTLNVTNDIIVGGNVYLQGNTTFINVATYQINDALMYIAANNTLTDSVDIGFVGGKNTSGTFSHTGLARDATDGKYKLFDNLADSGHVGNVIDFANTSLATLVANVEANTLTVVNGVSGNVNFDSGTLFVNSVGNAVGIGTTNPGELLTVNGSVGLQRSGTQYWHLSVDANNALNFTRSGVSDRVTISSDGNVGIGTTSPSGRLTIQRSATGANTDITFKNEIGDDRSRIRFGGAIEELAFWTRAGGDITERMRITAGGSVGIGTTNPATTLHVHSSQPIRLTGTNAGSAGIISVVGGLEFYKDSTPTYAYSVAMHPVGGSITNDLVFTSYDGAWTERLRITNGGNVGLGTTNPDSLGHGGTNRFFNIYNSGTSVNSQAHLILLSNASSQALSSIGSLSWGLPNVSATNKGVALIAAVTGASSTSANPSAYMTFFTRNTTESAWAERMRINEAGNVGIGTTSPSYPLHVIGTSYFSGNVQGTAFHAGGRDAPYTSISETSSGAMSVFGHNARANTSSANYITAQNSGYHSHFIRMYYDHGIAFHTSTGTRTAGNVLYDFGTPANVVSGTAERMRIDTGGNVAIGTTSPQATFDVRGNIFAGNNGADGFIKLRGYNNANASITTNSGVSSNYNGLALNSNENNNNSLSNWIVDIGGIDNIGRSGTGDTFNIARKPSGGGISTLFLINSSGNVGINNTSPGFKFDVSEAGAVISGTATTGSNMRGIRIYNTTTATTNNAIGLWMATGPHQAGIASFRADAASTWDTCLAFYTHGNATTNLNDATERMRISGEGYVTKPYHPRFLASRAGDYTGYNATSTGDAVVIYNNSVDNIGSHFNTSTGKFTAPVAGMYMFQASAFSSATFVQGWFVVNGTRASYTDNVFSSTGSGLFTCTGLIYLNANDNVGFHPYNGSDSNATIYGNVYHTWFKGYLIG